MLATYDEMMAELQAVMAAGGKQTDRMSALEARMSEEVKVAVPELFAVVQQGDQESADAAAFALKFAPDPQAAIPPLLAGLDRFDGGLANNVGLTLEYLCRMNPTLGLPTAPLAQALRAQAWTSQQKTAQVLEVLAQRGEMSDVDGSLAAALIPMLASQRVRVFGPARELLPKITMQTLGRAPQPWVKWFARAHGRTIDLAAGIYELVQVVRPAMRKGKESLRVEEKAYGSDRELLGRLKQDADTARGVGRRFGVVIQVPKDGFPQGRLYALADNVLSSLDPPVDLVVSPASDEFVPFSEALRNLRRLLNATRRPSGQPLPR